MRESEQRLALALRASHEGVWDWNVETGAVWYSSRHMEMLGYADSEIEPRASAFENLLHPDDRVRFHDTVEAVLRGEREHEIEFRLRHKDGHYVDILSCGFPIRRKPNGPIVRIVGTHFDLTERKRTEEALRQREEWLRLAHDAAHSGAWEWDLRTNLNIWSEELWKLYGLEPHCCEPSYAAWLEVVHPDDRPMAERTVQEAASQGIDLNVEFRVRDRDGAERWLLSRGRAIRDADGQVVRFIGIAVNITEQKRTEEALRKSERLYRAIGESIDYGVWVCAPDGRNTYASDSFLKLVGMTQQQCSDFGWGKVLHPDDADRTIAAWKECVRAGGMWDIEHRFRGADGQWHAILARGVPVRDEQGHITGWAGINLDISALKQAEEGLQRSHDELEKRNLEVERVNRMKTDFLGRSSHELRTPLNAILGYSELLAEQSAGPLPSPYPRFVANIQEGARHLLEIVNDLLDISKIEAGRVDLIREAFRPADALEEVLSVIAPLARIKHIAIDDQVPAGMRIRADRTRFKQVLYNLLSNAVKFTPENGRVWIADASRGTPRLSVLATPESASPPRNWSRSSTSFTR